MPERVSRRLPGMPRASGDVDASSREVTRDLRRLWGRNSNPFARRRIVDPTARVVVSMTTHGDRLRDVWVAIESIGRGTSLPARLILWLDQPREIPHRLRVLQRRGLEVRFVDAGNRVHTKYWPYLESAELETPLVLADDDIIYPPNWLAGLLHAHRETPELVVAYRAHVVGMSGEEFVPYVQWRSCDDDSASFAHFATTVSGQLLPVELQRALRDGGTSFRTVAPTSDDLWIHRTAVTAGIRTRQALPGQRHWPFVPGSQAGGLNAVNVIGGANDRQMAAAHSPTTRRRIRVDLEAQSTPD